jgi:hypothetical protein
MRCYTRLSANLGVHSRLRSESYHTVTHTPMREITNGVSGLGESGRRLLEICRARLKMLELVFAMR